MNRKLAIFLGSNILLLLYFGCQRDNTGQVMVGDETFRVHTPKASEEFARGFQKQNDTFYHFDPCNYDPGGPCEMLAVAFLDRETQYGVAYQNQILFDFDTGEIVGVRVYYKDSLEKEIDKIVSYSENMIMKKDSMILFVRGYKKNSYYVKGEMELYEPCFCNLFLPKDLPFYGYPDINSGGNGNRK